MHGQIHIRLCKNVMMYGGSRGKAPPQVYSDPEVRVIVRHCVPFC